MELHQEANAAAGLEVRSDPDGKRRVDLILAVDVGAVERDHHPAVGGHLSGLAEGERPADSKLRSDAEHDVVVADLDAEGAADAEGQGHALPRADLGLDVGDAFPGLDATVFLTVKNVVDTLYIADRSRGLLPGPPRLVQAGVKMRF